MNIQLADAATYEPSATRGGILLLVLLAAYLLPALIAICRRHHNKVPIILVNIFAGWTILGWFVAFIWSFTSPAPPQPIVINNQR